MPSQILATVGSRQRKDSYNLFAYRERFNSYFCMCFSEVSGDEGNLSAGRSPAESMIFGQKVNSWNSIQGSTSGDSEKKRLLDCQE